MDEEFDSLLSRAKSLLKSADTMAAVEYLSRAEDPVVVMKVYRDLVTQLYWKERNLPAVIPLAWSGIHYGMTYPMGKGTGELRHDLLGLAKTLAYNLASFTWPGWDEPMAAVRPTLAAVGLDAAKLNMRLAEELNKGDLPMCRGHWMLGALLMANGELERAKEQFDESVCYAERAESFAEVWLARGFAALTRWLDSPGDGEVLAEIRRHLTRLEGLEHGADFQNQIRTAARVFGAPLPME